MDGIGGTRIVLLMAAHALRGRAGKHTVHVATVAAGGAVRARQRECGLAVVKRCRPPGSHGVTPKTIRREPSMFWRSRSSVVLLMAADALGSRIVEVVPDMAPGTRCGRMGADKRESGPRVIKTAAPAGGIHRMALAAVGAETRRPVIGCLARLVRCRMTTITIRAHPDILVLLLIWMTCPAVGRQVLADQWKGCARVALGHVRDHPRLGSVAAIAIRTQFAPVQIVVASDALVVGPLELEGRVA